MRPGPASSGPSPDRRPLPPLAREPLAESPPPPSVEPRVVRARTVRRVTAGAAAAAVLGTVVFGGLAAAGSKDSASADDPAATTGGPTGDDGAQGDRGGDAMPGRFFDDGRAQTPSPSEQAPVAPSGAS